MGKTTNLNWFAGFLAHQQYVLYVINTQVVLSLKLPNKVWIEVAFGRTASAQQILPCPTSSVQHP